MFRQQIKDFLRSRGYDVIRYPSARSILEMRIRDCDVVFDVGANEGQYASWLRSIGYKGKIVSFEPVKSVFERLNSKVAEDSSWQAVNCALGDAEGTSEINVSELTCYSSILPVLESAVKYDNRSRTVERESIIVKRLDSLFNAYAKPGEKSFLKIDTQGYEKNVLAGATGCLDSMHGVQLEVCIKATYANETLATEIINCMRDLGFSVVWMEPANHCMREGIPTHSDALFLQVPIEP